MTAHNILRMFTVSPNPGRVLPCRAIATDEIPTREPGAFLIRTQDDDFLPYSGPFLLGETKGSVWLFRTHEEASDALRRHLVERIADAQQRLAALS
jgi:hypothetical protein